MKIIIIIEKYGGYCNRFFQSLHYHAFSIENNIYFFIDNFSISFNLEIFKEVSNKISIIKSDNRYIFLINL